MMFENLTWAELMACVDARWSPQIGDPTLGGWATVGSYALCALLAASAVTRARKGRERGFWTMVAVVMVFLAVNKQLDLQSALTAVGRCVSQLQGWYDERRAFQRQFILGLLAVAGAGLALGLFAMRQHARRNALAILGLGCVIAFVAVRAVGFHHVDVFLKGGFPEVRYNFLLENAGLILIALNALFLKAWTGRR